MGMEDLQRLREKERQAGAQSTGPLLPGTEAGMPRRPRRRGNKPLFSETHVRFTNYLRDDIAARIDRLREEGRLDRSLTEILNDALRKYLDTYY